MAPQNDSERLRLALPKGRMQAGVFSLLADSSISLSAGERSYRPVILRASFDVKILKPQNIVEMLVAAAPAGAPLVVAFEYERLTRAWIAERGLQASFLKSYGATEVFPPKTRIASSTTPPPARRCARTTCTSSTS